MHHLYKNRPLQLGLGAIVGIAVFVLAAQWSQQYSTTLQAATSEAGIFGIFAYISIMAVSIIVAPIGTGFLVPAAANSFGPFLAAVYSIVGWTIGSVVAFILARYITQTVFSDVVILKRIKEVEQKIPRWYLYALIIVLRMALPVDVVSYVLAVASTISFRAFLVTTVIGITPLTFAFTYAALSTLWVQVSVAIGSTVLFLGGLLFTKRMLTKPTE